VATGIRIRTIRRCAGALVVAAMTAALAGFAASPAKADLIGSLLVGSCPSDGTQVFAPWNDFASYFLAPNGGLESGSTGWTLSGGAKVVGGNEPFLPTGSHSLSLPSGSSAISPVTCIGPADDYVRLFGTDVGGTDGGLHARVYWYGLLNQLLGVTDFTTFTPGSSWQPTSKLSSSSSPLVVPLLGSTSARVQFTPVGNGSAWRIDDLYIDPWLSR
jgi:hypothetical protein